MQVQVKFLDGSPGSRDTAGHPFEGQPHSGSRRAKCPHLVDIRAASRSTGELAVRFRRRPRSCWQQTLGSFALPTRRARSSEAHTDCQQRFILPARRYEARSLNLDDTSGRTHPREWLLAEWLEAANSPVAGTSPD